MTTTEPRVISHWIDGADSPSSSGRTAPVYNPATGAVQAHVALAAIGQFQVQVQPV